MPDEDKNFGALVLDLESDDVTWKRYTCIAHVPVLGVRATFWPNLWSITEEANGNMESICQAESGPVTHWYPFFLFPLGGISLNLYIYLAKALNS